MEVKKSIKYLGLSLDNSIILRISFNASLCTFDCWIKSHNNNFIVFNLSYYSNWFLIEMNDLGGCVYTWIYTCDPNDLDIYYLVGGALSPPLLLRVAKLIVWISIMPINSLSSWPPYVTYLNMEAMVLTWLTLVLFLYKESWYNPKSLLVWSLGLSIGTYPSSIKHRIINIKYWYLLVTCPLW